MSSTSLTSSQMANLGSAQSCGSTRTNLRFTEAVMRKAHALFQTKIAAEMAARTRCGMRTAEHWKAGDREMDIADFLALLECEEGVAFLDVFWEFVPAIARDRWLKLHLLNRKLEEAERKAALHKRETEQLRFQLKNR